MKARPLAMVVSFALSSTALVSAQTSRRTTAERLEATGFLGGMSVSHDLGTATSIYMTVTGSADNVTFGKLYGLRASWAFNENLAAELNVSGGTTPYRFDVDDKVLGNVSLGDQFDARQILVGGNLIYQWPLEVGLVPYATGGVGYLKTTPSNPLGDLVAVSATDFNFGGGVKYFFPTPRWLGLRFDVRYHTATKGFAFGAGDTSPSGTELTVGAVARFF